MASKSMARAGSSSHLPRDPIEVAKGRAGFAETKPLYHHPLKPVILVRNSWGGHIFIRLTWILLLTSYLLGCQTLSDPQQGSAESTIRALLASQTADWNRGDIEAFMEGYVNSEDLRFAGAY